MRKELGSYQLERRRPRRPEQKNRSFSFSRSLNKNQQRRSQSLVKIPTLDQTKGKNGNFRPLNTQCSFFLRHAIREWQIPFTVFVASLCSFTQKDFTKLGFGGPSLRIKGLGVLVVLISNLFLSDAGSDWSVLFFLCLPWTLAFLSFLGLG